MRIIDQEQRQIIDPLKAHTHARTNKHTRHIISTQSCDVRTIIAQEQRLVIGGRAGAIEHLAQVKELPVNVSKLRKYIKHTTT